MTDPGTSKPKSDALAHVHDRIRAAQSGDSTLDLSNLSLSLSQLIELWEILSQLHHLERLDLSNNHLTVLPESLSTLSQLRHIDISHNQLTNIPQALGRLTNLTHLALSHNNIATLPLSLRDLSSLRFLDVSHNNLRVLSIDFTQLPKLTTLLAYGNALTGIPDSIADLSQLRELSLSSNRLEKLPSAILSLGSLRSLCLSSNRLASLPTTIENLQNLSFLALDGNPLRKLPHSIGRLSKLTGLALMAKGCVLRWSDREALWAEHEGSQSHDTLGYLPGSLTELRALRYLFLHGQSPLELPPEVVGPTWEEVQGPTRSSTNPSAILDYYLSKRISLPLNEAKMILVGRGGVGKTSLINRLVHNRYSQDEPKTDGIAITQWNIPIGSEQIRLNVWDFGGQEIMHATHQFFLTKRSLYLLVLNAREGEQDANVEYWLQMIDSFGGDSPILVVINKIDDNLFDLNRRGLHAKFPSIRGFFQTDCDSAIGLEALREAIAHETDRLEYVRDPFPASWFAVKSALADLRQTEGQNFISFARYQELCAEKGIEEVTSQDTLVAFLHDLGIVVNFRNDPRLAETHVLNPEWVTNGIYKILNAQTLARRQGELHLLELRNVLDAKEYPAHMHLYLLDLMRKFELCYEFYETSGHYLVPELLGKEEPDLPELSAIDALRFQYSYNVVPEGLLPRFIVRSRALNRDLPRWRSGVVLSWDGNRAVVTADVQEKRVSIVVGGPTDGRRRLLAVVRADLEYIHSSVAKLQCIEQVPIPGHRGLVVEYDTLRVLEAAGEKELTLVHNGKVIKSDVAGLLNGVDEKLISTRGLAQQAARTGVRVVFSYAHKDEELRDQLEAHLKLLQRQGVISTWHDRKIMPGEQWAGVIDDRFRRAEIVLLLVSADFLASDYCYQVEVATALERSRRGEAKVVPVIVRACDWTRAPFGALQGMPKDGVPVTSWPNRDEAWNDVAKGIGQLATHRF